MMPTSAPTRDRGADGSHRAAEARVPTHTPVGRGGGVWVLATVVLVAALACVPVYLSPGFYYFDDTAGGAFGQWWELGQQLRQGRWPMLSVDGWYAGNYLVEGQWGLYNPPVWLIALASTLATDAAVFSAGVKIVFLALGGLGVHLVARSMGASHQLALLAGVAAPIAGFTLYLDATAWVTNLEVWAWFFLTWWGLRRHLYGRGSLVVAFALGFLLVTVGYVQGTLMLVLLYIGLLVEQAVARSWRTLLRTLFVGITHGLVAVTVYLPGLASSGVSVREDTIRNDAFMTLTLNGLAVSAAPMARADLLGWWGRYAPMPYAYIAWFLPLLVLLPWSRIREVARAQVGALVVLGTVFLLAVGPSQLGPLRFPIRSLPWVATTIIILTCVALATVGRDGRRPGAGRLAAALALVAAGHWLSWSAAPDLWKQHVIAGLALAGAVVVLWWVAQVTDGVVARRRPPVFAGIAVAVTIAVFGVQSLVFARHADEHFGVEGVPSSIEELQAPLDAARGNVMVIGNPIKLSDALWPESTMGNLWYLTPHAAINLYSPIGFEAFAHDLCVSPYYGLTCYDGLQTLFTPDDETGELVVDLIGIDTIQVLARPAKDLARDPDGPDESVAGLTERFGVPEGWHRADADDVSFTWVRDEVTPPLGLPTWTSPGLQVSVVDQVDERIRLRVDAVGPEGGQVVFSRLAWPGYTVTGGTLADPLRGYLLRVDVPAGSAGQEVVVTFRPPLWSLQVATLVASFVLVAGATFVAAGRRLLHSPRRPRAADLS